MTREQVQAIQEIAIESPDETVRASILLERAAQPDHPWHSAFEWDDSAAAHHYRLNQARTIIRSVRSVIVRGELSPRPIVYIKHPERKANEEGHVAVQTLVGTETARKALDLELARVASAVLRGRRVADELGLRDVFDEALVALIDTP